MSQLGLEQFRLIRDDGLSLEGDAAAEDPAPASGSLGPEVSLPEHRVPRRTRSTLKGDRAATPSPSGIVEALLFVGKAPVSAAEAASLVRGIRPEEVDRLISSLGDAYRRQGRPYEVAVAGGGYVLRLRREFERVAQRLYGRSRVIRLSQAAVDVLALVAYRQPIKRQEIENVRGTNCGALLRQLLRRGLLRITREGSKSQEVVYRTSERFLHVLSLSSLHELPRAEDLERL